jgi:hypothetical protein
LAEHIAPRFVHRWFTAANPTCDQYEVTVLRYDVSAHRSFCLMPTGLWREVPVGAETTPWLVIPGHELNPFLARPDFRQLVTTQIRTRVAPLLEQLQVELNWVPSPLSGTDWRATRTVRSSLHNLGI